jgi:nucleoside-diphosphate-sugar epimerase
VLQIELTPGEQKRDFIYIDDVVSAYMLLLEKGQNTFRFSEYDVGSGEAVSIRRFVETAKRLSESTTDLLFGKKTYRDHEIMHSQADVGPLKMLGWTPMTSLENGILKSL